MAVSIKIGLQQTQRLALTQSLKQSIEMLQLSTIELAEVISRELQENPVIEEGERAVLPAPDPDDASVVSRINSRLSGDESVQDRREQKDLNYADASDSGYGGSFDEGDKMRSFIENSVVQQETLQEHLLSQARLAARSEEEYRVLEGVITSIDDRGLLGVDLEELARQNSVTVQRVREAIAVIAGFEPPGCGAPSIRESLLFQASQSYPGDTLLQKMLGEHFRELEKLDYEKIARATGVPVAEVLEKSRLVHALTPYPGRRYSMREARYIIPDVEVRRVGDDIIVTINDDWIPEIRINGYYLNLLKKKNIDKNLRDYIKDKLQSARYLLKNISGRRETIIKVVGAIMQRQREFLLEGPGHLKPLTHGEIAAEVGLHESTVSRVTSNKFVQTAWGVFEMKYFFVSRLRSGAAEAHSSDKAINLIKGLISGEDPKNPLSDEEILARLEGLGMRLARRTVAKYRGALQIPPSGVRKKLNMMKSEVKA